MANSMWNNKLFELTKRNLKIEIFFIQKYLDISNIFRNFALEFGKRPKQMLWTSASDEAPTLKGHEPVPANDDAIAPFTIQQTTVSDEANVRQRRNHVKLKQTKGN